MMTVMTEAPMPSCREQHDSHRPSEEYGQRRWSSPQGDDQPPVNHQGDGQENEALVVDDGVVPEMESEGRYWKEASTDGRHCREELPWMGRCDRLGPPPVGRWDHLN